MVLTLRDGDELFFSTTRDRLKAKTVEGDARVAVTFLDDGAPHRFVTVEGAARIDGDHIIDAHVQLNRALRGPDFTPPDDFAQRLAKQGRVIVRIRAERVSGVTER